MKISVIIPCYNCSSTIRKSVQSVIRQNYQVFEIICINDGSTDETLNVLEELKSECSENILFQILNQTNKGPSVARNRGIEAAQGDWIAFLDSDDYWLENKTQQYATFLTEFRNTKLLGSLNMNPPYLKISFNKLLFKNYFKTSAVMVSRKCLDKHKFNINKSYSEDYNLWLNIAYENEAYVISPQTAFALDDSKENHGFYSGSGLSSRIWQMQKGELLNYYECYIDKKISKTSYLLVTSYSSIKFLRRALNIKTRKIFNR